MGYTPTVFGLLIASLAARWGACFVCAVRATHGGAGAAVRQAGGETGRCGAWGAGLGCDSVGVTGALVYYFNYFINFIFINFNYFNIQANIGNYARTGDLARILK